MILPYFRVPGAGHRARGARLRQILIAALAACALPWSSVWAQQAPAPASAAVPAGETPPVMPRTVETPLPPTITLPAPTTVPSDVPNRPLTADEAARIALHHQTTVAAAAANVTAAVARTQQTRSGLGPNLGVGAGYTRSDQILSGSGREGGGSVGTATGGGGSVTTTSGFQTSANVRQLLFDYAHTRTLVRQAEAQQRSTVEALTRTQSDLVLQVKQGFYTYLQNTRLVGVSETNLRSQNEHLALAQARLKAGVGLPLDVVRSEAAVADATFNLTTARNNAATARVALALLMGIDPRTPIVAAANSTEPAVGTNDVNDLVTRALENRPEVHQAQATVEASQFAVSAARTSNAPALSANVGLASRGNSFPPLNGFLSAGLQISWSPFDAGLTRGRVAEAQANLAAAQAQLIGIQQGAVSDVSQSYLNLRTAEQRVTTAQASVANAQEAQRLATGRWANGVGTFIDVLDAQTALLTAQTNLVNAQSAVDQARAALAHAIGVVQP